MFCLPPEVNKSDDRHVRFHNLTSNRVLSATLAKSGPLDFPSEKSFLLFFAHEKGLGHMFQK